ncbi:hypothetical protein BWQ96_01397 [Gracilariopsis chorda]|uniref:TLC domain-containing protein n=1 Tax=Gracilariopsis chorda TaxID=448386 RepID=A0A2V3J317_9FLOR|nr:hypothetical protein BWQ96_01397 [Gracilariopsis chorda]|eukprot:PXF48841.1 hypothetical protein BWQ96_01397 [Gracilariopsis chorda]
MLSALSLALVALCWQLVYIQCKKLLGYLLSREEARQFIPDAKVRDILSEQGPAYLVSTIHALYVTKRGLEHLHGLLHAPVARKLLHPYENEPLAPLEAPFVAESERVLWTNLVLAGYLTTDLLHVVKQYPRLGEASTPFLNARWLLIKMGRGSSWYFGAVETMFGVLFIVTRLFVYVIGLIHQLYIIRYVPSTVPRWAVIFCSGCIVAGFILNMTWLNKIYKLASGQGKRHAQRAEQTASPSRSSAEDGVEADSATGVKVE